MNKTNTKKKYDLEDRTFEYAKKVALYCKKLPKNITNLEYIKQVARSSGSVGANYIEANESLSRKDFAMRVKISRKESKESAYWLKLLVNTNSDDLKNEGIKLINESIELKRILSSIIEKL